MQEAVISLKNVDIYQQETKVLESVSLRIDAGEWVYLIGKVGSGKSSLIKTLHAELPVETGDEAIVAGFNLLTLRQRDVPYLRRKLGVVFQDFRLLSDRTIYDNLAFVLRATNWSSNKEIKERILDVVEKVKLDKHLDKMPHELSGGEQQRAAIARALLNDPDIILADEPTGNLDPETSVEIMDIFRKINRRGKTVLMATHDYLMQNNYAAGTRTLLCANGHLYNSSSATEDFNFGDELLK
ncbi:MAG: ATP-binding cassette domain-containing protein [Bacteroidales bacterium]|jgi:cell division transport system ATP-binding protein|nr:ATP-binding cassette domain-containing protein [Bacteroidales bacterium]